MTLHDENAYPFLVASVFDAAETHERASGLAYSERCRGHTYRPSATRRRESRRGRLGGWSGGCGRGDSRRGCGAGSCAKGARTRPTVRSPADEGTPSPRARHSLFALHRIRPSLPSRLYITRPILISVDNLEHLPLANRQFTISTLTP